MERKMCPTKCLSVFLVLGMTFTWPTHPQTTLQLGAEKRRVYDFIHSEQQYFELLQAADPQTYADQFEPEILILLDDDLKNQYLQLTSLDEKKDFVEYFWKAQNPNPLLSENDRLLDHLLRRVYARRHFPRSVPPFFDDRGKYYIKYGRPRFRYKDFGGTRSIKSLVTIQFNFYSVLPNESWSYVNVAPNFVVHFAKENDDYVEIESLKEVIRGSQRRGRVVWYWSDLLKNRFWMSSLINDAVTEFINTENDLLNANGGAVVVDELRAVSRRIERDLFLNLINTDRQTREASLFAPVAVYTPIRAKNRLPFTPTVAQFRGPGASTRVEVFMLSPLKKYVRRSIPPSNNYVDVEFSCLLQDSLFNTLDVRRQRRHFSVKRAIDNKLDYVVGTLSLVAQPQEATVYFQVQNNDNKRIGFDHKPLTLRDFSGSDLMVSDIQFFLAADEDSTQQVLPIIEKQDTKLTPYPFKKVKKSQPLYCYFEIYNLQTLGTDEELDITYKVYTDQKSVSLLKKISRLVTGGKQSSISIVQTQPVDRAVSRELIALDLGKLDNGPYELEITVSAANDKNIWARTKKAFDLTD